MKTEKSALVTGSTGGIGVEVSKLLAANGWNLIILNRSEAKAEKQINDLKEVFPERSYHSYISDMMDLSDLGKVIEKIGTNHPKISALYNIAGILTDQRLESAQGIEGHFAVNTVSSYLMIQGLRKQLGSGSSSNERSVVVNFSSSAIKSVKKLEIEKLTNPEDIGGLMGAYATSKLAITIVTDMLRDELFEEGILIYSADPGPTKTSMTGSGDGMPWLISFLRPILFKAPEAQAKKLVSAIDASVRENASGRYISEGKRKSTPAMVSDKELQAELRSLLDSRIENFLPDRSNE
ncbi:MAG: SDR family NAD(P)-dependent oxidoreductase [Verrucomicrobiota bacterium]